MWELSVSSFEYCGSVQVVQISRFWKGATVMASGGLVAARQEFEKHCVESALKETGGNVTQAARLLGIDRTNLHKKIQAYGLGGEKGGPA